MSCKPSKFQDRTIPPIKNVDQALEERIQAMRISSEQKVNALMGKIEDMQKSLDSLWRVQRQALLESHKKNFKPRKIKIRKKK